MGRGWSANAYTVARRWLAAVLCLALLLAGATHIAAASPALARDYQIQADTKDYSSLPCEQDARGSRPCCAGSAGCAFTIVPGGTCALTVPAGRTVDWLDQELPVGLPTAPPPHPPRASITI